MALAMGRRPGDQFDFAGRKHADRCVLPPAGHVLQGTQGSRGSQAAHLREGGDTDAELNRVARLPASLLLGPQLIHAEEVHCFRGCGLVVAGVVGEPRHRCVGELLVRDPVLLAERHRIHVEFRGEFIHHSLDRVRCFRSPSPAVCVGGRGAREYARALEVVGVHLVDRRVHEHPEQGGAGGNDLQVGTHVGEEIDLEPEQGAVFRGSDLDVLDLVATVVRGDHVLAPAFGPLDRTAEFARYLRNENFLAIDLELPAEASANIGSDDAQVVLEFPSPAR